MAIYIPVSTTEDIQNHYFEKLLTRMRQLNKLCKKGVISEDTRNERIEKILTTNKPLVVSTILMQLKSLNILLENGTITTDEFSTIKSVIMKSVQGNV